MRLLTFSFLFSVVVCFTANAQTRQPAPAKPKLVIGLVIDQMRWDFLYRYQNRYRADGFNRLLQQGFSCENTMIPYTPTYTAPGHACVYTGSVPAINGIIGNNWYSKTRQKNVYCTDDDTAKTIGATSKAGRMSPANMWATTITDELKLATNQKAKTIGIALKDRGAILPAGHSADAAYWYDDASGGWISSSHYFSSLPTWVNQFNAQNEPVSYLKNGWNTLYPIGTYTASTADNNNFENNLSEETQPVFPHRYPTATNKANSAFRHSPFAATYTFDFAKAAIVNEKMGTGSTTDFLAISISSTDYLGHSFGPNSIEIEDTYLRLDNDIAQFLQYLDARMGKGNYLLFLTADHGAAHVPRLMQQYKIPAGWIDDGNLRQELNELLNTTMGLKPVKAVINYQVYLADSLGDKKDDVTAAIMAYLQKQAYITHVVELEELAESALPEPIKTRMINGYAPSRSGDIQFVLKPGYFDGWDKGTTHGLWNPYDAHIPLLFFGWGIGKGKLYRETYMTDIAATLAALLQIQMPNGCVGHVITEVFKK
jgi:predicted AlkP superfamily pyrophosphatase or phosphodiesterase